LIFGNINACVSLAKENFREMIFCAGLAGVAYIFFKYIASDEEESSSPASASGNGAVDVPLQPSQPPAPPGKWNLEPLKRIAELRVQFPDVRDLVKRRFSRAGGKRESPEGNNETGPANIQQRAEASIPEAESKSTRQVSFCSQDYRV